MAAELGSRDVRAGCGGGERWSSPSGGASGVGIGGVPGQGHVEGPPGGSVRCLPSLVGAVADRGCREGLLWLLRRQLLLEISLDRAVHLLLVLGVA